MSETVSYSGRIKLVAEGKEAAEKYTIDYLKINEIELSDEDLKYYDSKSEWLVDNKTFVILNDFDLYMIVSKEDRQYDDIFIANKTFDDKEFEYIVQYHNGGCCFSEALECSLKNLKNK